MGQSGGDDRVNSPFLGEYRHVVDEKGRISVPVKFRPFLGNKFYLARVFEPCLVLFPQEEWIHFKEKLTQMNMTSSRLRAFQRKVFSGALECVLDRAGRFLIPQNLREYAKLDGEVVLIGVGSKMEIWDKKEWVNYLNTMEETHQGFSEELGQLNL